MHSMSTLYESFMEKHGSIDSAASGLKSSKKDVFSHICSVCTDSVGCGMLSHKSIFGLDLELMQFLELG
ncbi:hypothetical protein L2E82_11731 [Cichorium intybus]|uniref:Uncharacterized protein n=1 Tax=Cichorium intybus TaxID=13427 RepID=A0ACB9GDW0_CICIN|nr:hypothetical protein L2E82_11731 [Cichorium intybus]